MEVVRVMDRRAASEVDGERARALLRAMVSARVFDERAFALQRQGWMSGYPPFRGQEASQVGAAMAMGADDWLVPTYRSNAMQLTRGVPMADILRFRRGYPEFLSGHEVPVFPQAIPVASQIPHATGLAMAATYRDTAEAVVCYLGDGATSEGDFHEGVNFAGVFDAPVVFFCENNGWAISTPTTAQTASDTIAGKAEAYGIAGLRVDGTDPLAVYESVAAALSSARAGMPVLLESLTLRHGPHTTSDDPDRYTDQAEFPAWRTRDPIERFAAYLVDGGVVGAEFVASVRAEAETAFAAARRAAETAAPSPSPDAVFDSVYASPPAFLQEQRRELEEWIERQGDPTNGE